MYKIRTQKHPNVSDSQHHHILVNSLLYGGHTDRRTHQVKCKSQGDRPIN